MSYTPEYLDGIMPDKKCCPFTILPAILSVSHIKYTNNRCGEREAHNSWSIRLLNRQHPFTQATLRITDPVLVGSRQ